jgi:hypothetical protein
MIASCCLLDAHVACWARFRRFVDPAKRLPGLCYLLHIAILVMLTCRALIPGYNPTV